MCHLLRCFHSEDGKGELALNIPDVLVVCMTMSRFVFAFACTEN